MSTSIRWESVDDASPDIGYVGNSWFAINGSMDAAGQNGPPFLSTQHGTNTSASFTLNFTGSGLRVMGAYTGTDDNTTMSWTCFVDGVNRFQGNPQTGYFGQNGLMLCDLATNVLDGHHTVVVNATVGANQVFWFDKIQYVPSAGVSLENKTIQLDRTDLAITYGYGWDKSSYATQTRGSQLGCNFYGVSVIWYGAQTGGNSTTGTWAIDGGSPTTFNVTGYGTSNITVYNELFFETPRYSMGPHSLVVTYNGDNSTTPLSFSYLVVQNGTLPHSTSSSSPSPSATNSSSSTNVGAIIGGVLGAAASLLIVFLLLFYRHRRNSEEYRSWRRSSFIHAAKDLSSPDTMAPALQSYQTQGQAQTGLSPNYNATHASGPDFLSVVRDRPQDGQLIGNVSRFDLHEPSRGDLPRKLQYMREGLGSEDEQRYPRNPLDSHPASFGGPIGSSDGGVQLSDTPPAYSMS